MVNGLPGPMAHAVAVSVLKRNLTLAEMTLCGPSGSGTITIENVVVKLYGPSDHEKGVEDARKKYPELIVVDYTQPQACLGNCKLYTANKLDFVMGTTGGDTEAMEQMVREAGVRAVIAPNMCKAIVALQALLEDMSKKFPNAFNGFDLKLTESHQVSKKDTSGTAKAMISSFNGLGVPFKVDDVTKIRDVEQAKAFGVPETAMQGHAYHTYDLTNDSVQVQFQHNVVGRIPYAEGTVDAVVFLQNQKPGVYSMIDILSSGGLA